MNRKKAKYKPGDLVMLDSHIGSLEILKDQDRGNLLFPNPAPNVNPTLNVDFDEDDFLNLDDVEETPILLLDTYDDWHGSLRFVGIYDTYKVIIHAADIRHKMTPELFLYLEKLKEEIKRLREERT